MKRTVRMITALSSLALLALSSIPLGGSLAPAKTSAQSAVAEVEPNDDPLSAQEIPFPGPGEKVEVQGSVAAGDEGSFSEEMETFFSFAGGVGTLHDWYVLDPDALGKQALGNGPIPLKISVGWEGETDIDVWVGTLVDDFLFFFDGFKLLSDVRMASLANPEMWPRGDAASESIALYLQPQGVTDEEGNPIPNDGFGRKLVVAIQHFDGPPADYTLTIENGASVAKQDVSFNNERHQIDDGGITAGWFSGPSGGIVVNCYRPSRYPATLTSIAHPFVNFSDVPDPTGQPLRVIVFTGEDDGDGLPGPPPPLSQANILFDQEVPIPGTISPQEGSRFIGRVNDITIDPPITIESGVVYVALQWPDAPIEETGVALALDTSPVQYLRTFLSTDGGETWGRPTRTEDLSGEDVFMNADIRAHFEFGPAPASVVRSKAERRSHRVVRAVLSRQPLSVVPISR